MIFPLTPSFVTVKKRMHHGESMNEPLVCVSFEGVTTEEILEEAARANLAGADLAELRYDRFFLIRPEEEEDDVREEEEGDEDQVIDEMLWERRGATDIEVGDTIAKLKDGIPLPVIFTCRPIDEGGYYPGNEKSRIAILEHAIESEVSWVDIEISMSSKQRKKLVAKAAENGVKVIASVHGTDGVPGAEEIIDIVKSNAENGDLVKCCYRTSNHQESLAIIDAAEALKDSEIDNSLMGLGPGGDWTRIHAPLLEQAMVYATLRNDFKLYEEGLINVKDVRETWILLEY
jgi:3-dehydroquinate dehydratase type I